MEETQVVEEFIVPLSPGIVNYGEKENDSFPDVASNIVIENGCDILRDLPVVEICLEGNNGEPVYEEGQEVFEEVIVPVSTEVHISGEKENVSIPNVGLHIENDPHILQDLPVVEICAEGNGEPVYEVRQGILEDFPVPVHTEIQNNGVEMNVSIPDVTSSIGSCEVSSSDQPEPMGKKPQFDGRIIWLRTDGIEIDEAMECDQEVEITTSESYCALDEFSRHDDDGKNCGENGCDILRDLPVVEICPEGNIVERVNGSRQDVVEDGFDNTSEEEWVEDYEELAGERIKIGVIMCQSCGEKFRTPEDLKEHAKTEGFKKIKGAKHEPSWKKHVCCLCGYTTDRLWSLKIHVISIHEGKKPFQCPHCDYSSTQFGNLKTHISSRHTEERPYVCSHCGYRATAPGALKRHVLYRHTNDNSHLCRYCDFKANSSPALKCHMTAHHSKDRPHHCHYCDFSATTSSALKCHITSVHTKEKPYECSVCDYTSSQYTSWKNHVLSLHTPDKSHQCSECEFQTFDAEELKSHLKDTHNKRVMLECPHCSFITLKPTTLEIHINSEHVRKTSNEPRPEFQCNYCDYKAYKQENLKRHIGSKHMSQKAQECPFCGLRAVSFGGLKRHIKAVHVKRKYFVCSYCRFSASLATDLEHHVLECHQDEKKQHRCHQCMFSSDSAAELTNHIVSEHLRPSRGQCPYCDYKDANTEALAVHIRSSHAKQNTYRCPHCEFSSTTKEDVRNHVYVVHKVAC